MSFEVTNDEEFEKKYDEVEYFRDGFRKYRSHLEFRLNVITIRLVRQVEHLNGQKITTKIPTMETRTEKIRWKREKLVRTHTFVTK